MWGFLALLVAGSGLLYVANELKGHGVHWAYQFCLATGDLCGHSDWIAIIPVCIACGYLLMRNITA